MTFLATWPFLKRIIVGIERTSYFAAVCWFSSTLSLTIRRSCRSLAISSRTGPTTRQGPHHGAQKSTRTGVSDSSTSAWKLVSVTSLRVPAILSCRSFGEREGRGQRYPHEQHYTKCSVPCGAAVTAARRTA